jgi:hypothetical protein
MRLELTPHKERTLQDLFNAPILIWALGGYAVMAVIMAITVMLWDGKRKVRPWPYPEYVLIGLIWPIFLVLAGYVQYHMLRLHFRMRRLDREFAKIDAKLDAMIEAKKPCQCKKPKM